MTPDRHIVVHNARENNLKDVNLKIPHDEMVVFTGVSGSGKSSLAFDTIFTEAQRRYLQSLSAYARQFIGDLQKPDVDKIEDYALPARTPGARDYRRDTKIIGRRYKIQDFGTNYSRKKRYIRKTLRKTAETRVYTRYRPR